MNAEWTWYEGKWNNSCWKTPDHWSSSSSCSWTLQAGTQHPWMGHWERHSPWSNQWNRPVDITTNDPRQHGDGWGEVIPTIDGADFRPHKRPVRLFAHNAQVAPEKRAGKLLERLERRAFESCGRIQDLEHRMVLKFARSFEDMLRADCSIQTKKCCGRLRLQFRASVR